MASNWTVCGICDFKHVTKPSVVWCSECDEGLCDDCKEHHSISKASREHDTVPINDYQNLPTEVLQVTQSCRKHNQKYQIFCKIHDCPCCKKCFIDVHNECKEFVDIDDVIKDVKSSNAFNEIEHTLSDIAEFMQKVRRNREENLLSIRDNKKQIENEIQQAKSAINNHLDTLQQKLIAELNITLEKEEKNIHQFLKSVEQNEKEIKEFQSSYSKIRQHASELQTFLTLKQMEHHVATKEEFIQSIREDDSLMHVRFFCKIDTHLENLTNNVKKFGEVLKKTKPINIPFLRQKDKQAQLIMPVTAKSVDDLTLTLVQSVDTYSEETRGCTILPDTRLVFTCYLPGYVTVVKPDGSKDFDIKSGHAFDVIYLGDNIIAVTSGNFSQYISLIDIELKNVKKTLNVGKNNDGIALKDKDLIYCERSQGLKKMSLSDDSVRKIMYSKLSSWSYVTTFNDIIMYTEKEKNTVTCINMQGQVNWIFKDENILKYPQGLSVDNYGNVYVVGRDSCNVVVISPDGQRHRQLLSAKDGLQMPSVLNYDRVSNKLLVANLKDKAYLFDVAS